MPYSIKLLSFKFRRDPNFNKCRTSYTFDTPNFDKCSTYLFNIPDFDKFPTLYRAQTASVDKFSSSYRFATKNLDKCPCLCRCITPNFCKCPTSERPRSASIEKYRTTYRFDTPNFANILLRTGFKFQVLTKALLCIRSLFLILINAVLRIGSA